MSPVNSLSRARIEREASSWILRLEAGELNEPDQAEFERWLAADPEHAWVLAQYRELTAQFDTQLPLLLDPEVVESVVHRATARQRWRRRLVPVLAAAAALAIAAVAWWLQPEGISTGLGERRALTLADGSRVELNALTRLSVTMSRHERHVELAQGEALFQVTHDAARPFFVETPAGTVRVTGTKFDVRAASGTEVTVLEGTVQVRPAAEAARPVVLTVGDQATVGPGGAQVRELKPDDLQNVVAWRVGQVAFQAEPLGEALARFAPYHAGPIWVSPQAAAINVGGRYSLDDLDGFLAAIEQVLPVSVLRSRDGAVRVTRRQLPSN